MFGFIRSITFAVQSLIPILALILFGIAWFFPGNMRPDEVVGSGYYYVPTDGWLYTVWAGLAGFPLWLQMAPSFLAAFFTSLLLVGNDMQNMLFGRRSYAIAFLFLFLLGSSGHFLIFHPAFLAGMLLVLSQRFLLSLYKNETNYSLVFVMGFTLGSAILLYPPLLMAAPAMLIGLLLMVSTNWRHWMVTLLGLVLPALLAAVCWFLIGDLEYQTLTFFSWFDFRQDFLHGPLVKEPYLAAWLGIILIWVVIASLKYRNPKIQSRQLFQSNFLLFLLTLLSAVFMESVSVEVLWILVIPVSYFMTFWALEVRRAWMRDLFFFTLLLAYVFFRIRGLVL